MDAARIHERVGLEDVSLRPGTDGDDGVGGGEGLLLGPRRHPIATTELLGLPWSRRLQRMRADDMRHSVQLAGKYSADIGVPGMRMDKIKAGCGFGHFEVN